MSISNIEWATPPGSGNGQIRVTVRYDGSTPPSGADSIGTNTTWDGIVQLTGDVVVKPGATLTVSEGAQVYANASGDLRATGVDTTRVELAVLGALETDGTSGAHSVFSSSRDDAFVHFHSAAKAAAASGDWYGVRLSDLDSLNAGYTDWSYARGGIALEDGGLTTSQLNGVLGDATLGFDGNVSDVSFDRDVIVAVGDTLEVPAGVRLGFRDTDAEASQSGEIDAARPELIVNGVLKAEGTSGSRITMTSDDPSASTGGWYGVRFKDAAINDSTWDASVSSLKHVDFDYPVFAITVDSLSGNIVDCTFDHDSSDIFVPKDTRIVEGYQWSLDAPMTVMADTTDASTAGHGGEDSTRVEINVSGELRTQDPDSSGDVVEFIPRIADHFDGNAWYGVTVFGTGWSGDGVGVARVHNAKFDSAIFPLTFFDADTAEVADSEFWHYQDTGVTDFASDATISACTFVRDLASTDVGASRDGRVGIHSAQSISTIAGNTIFFQSDKGIWIDAGTKVGCLSGSPVPPNRTIAATWNHVTVDTSVERPNLNSEETGIKVNWACNERNVAVTGNGVRLWRGRGIALEDVADVAVQCNCIKENYTGVTHKRTYLGVDATWNDVNKLYRNNISADSMAIDARGGPTATEGGLRAGKTTSSATGENRLQQGRSSALNYKMVGSGSGRTDYAESLEWFNSSDSLLTTAGDILATVEYPSGDSVSIYNYIDAADTLDYLSISGCHVTSDTAICAAPSQPTYVAGSRAKAVRLVTVPKPPREGGWEGTSGEETRTGSDLPSSWALQPARPNPSNVGVEVGFSVPVGSRDRVDLRVYDVTGRRVVDLVDSVMPPGRYRVTWDGRDSNGRAVAAGVFFIRMRAGSYSATAKIVHLR